MSELKTIAGRKFANKSSSFLILSNPLSGLCSKGRPSHFGPPTAPRRIASELNASDRTLSVSGSLYLSIDSPPIDALFISKFKLIDFFF